MRVLVVGATGAIGRRAVPLLLAHGCEVTAAGRSPERLTALARAGARTVALDLLDRVRVHEAVAGHDAVVNLATRIPPGVRGFLPGAWRATARLRREGAAILAAAATATGVGRLVQESLALAYPDSGADWITEDTPLAPARYDRTVLDAERAVDRFSAGGGVGVVLRFAMLYGPGDGFTRDLIASARRGWMPILGARDAYVSLVTHHDAAAAVVAALQLPAGAYNVADDQPMRRGELALALGALLRRRAPRLLPEWLRWLGGSYGETIGRSLRISNATLRRASAWAPRARSARDGLREALAPASRGAAAELSPTRPTVAS